ncbi:MAG TPA: sodium:alanine symporter family protein [Thiopseudomonas sp.]|nr:sodium:alanine symporter family protein [Thiopseudomonas sp.]
MHTFNSAVTAINDLVWGPPMLIAILGSGLFLMLSLRLMPLRNIKRGFLEIWNGRSKGDASIGEISPFAALMTSLAATVGTGNIAGVATAIVLGGPGALFWMWCTALVGMATKYCEVVLAVHFREKNSQNHFVGGPMYAIKNGLSGQWAWLGACFAIFGGLASFGIGNMVQVNSMAAGLEVSFAVPAWVSGLCIMALVGLVILGGIQRIGAVAQTLVPFMCVAYILATLFVLISHYQAIPAAFILIIDSAFNGHAAAGGFAGAAMIAALRFGVARGVFSNEAGLGSAGIAQAAGTSDEPVESGLIGMMGTFIDTLIVCTMTGLAIICSGVWTSGLTGAALSSAAFESAMPGTGHYLLTTALVVFAFTTIIGWSYYGERCWEFLFGARAILPYRLLWVAMVPLGAVTQLDTVWLLADTLNGLMALPNIISLLLLSPVVIKLTKTYFAKTKTH